MTDTDIVNSIIEYIKDRKCKLWNKGQYHDIPEENKIRFEELSDLHVFIHNLYNKD